MKAALRYVGDPGEDVGEPGERIDFVETRGAEEAEHHRSALAATIRPDEQPCLSATSHVAQLTLGGVIGEAYPAIGKEAGEA